MGYIVNDVVKMKWTKEGWMQAPVKEENGVLREGVFMFASQLYTTEQFGEITVFFTPDTAFLFISDQGEEDEHIWTAEELGRIMKEHYGDSFPVQYDEYFPLIDMGEEECMEDMLEIYDLLPFKADIEQRLMDVAPYGIEYDLEMDKEKIMEVLKTKTLNK